MANLGLTLPEAKQVLARVQQAVVAAQAHDHAVPRPDCSSCCGRYHVKDWRLHQVATLFGTVAVRLPRFRCAGCGCTETCISWPSHCRSTPELYQLRAHLSALMPFVSPPACWRIFCRPRPARAPRHSAAIRSRSVSNFVRSSRSSRRRPRRPSPSLWIRPSSVAAMTANGIWKFASAMSRLPTGPAGLQRRREDRYRHRGADPPKPGDGRPNRRHEVDRVHRWLPRSAVDFGRCRGQVATDSRLVPHRHAAPARKASGERIVDRPARPSASESRDRRRGRAPAGAALCAEREGAGRPITPSMPSARAAGGTGTMAGIALRQWRPARLGSTIARRTTEIA